MVDKKHHHQKSAQPLPQELIDTAEALWQAGISAIVANRDASNTRYPKSWTRYCDNIPNQAERDGFRKLLRDGYNTVAIATGIVIDDRRLVALDVDESRIANFVRRMVPSPSHRFGSQGTGLFCWVDKNDAFFKKKQIAAIHGHSKAAIELQTRGQNLIVPPSFQPKTGELYQWTGKPVWECLDELPTLTRETWAIIEAVVEHHSGHAGGQTVEPLLDGEATHDAGLTLTYKLATLCEDHQIRDIIFDLLPKDYDGDLLEELPRMIVDARRKLEESASDAALELPDDTIESYNRILCTALK